MPTSLFANSLIAAAAAAGVALTSLVDAPTDAYADASLTQLSVDDATSNAIKIFARADLDGDAALSADEFAALSIVTAELAHLNGFVAIETGDKVKTIALANAGGMALSQSEHARIEAVARHAFYAFAGEDGLMAQSEFLGMQAAQFAASDINANGKLNRRELSIYAQRQAHLPAGA